MINFAICLNIVAFILLFVFRKIVDYEVYKNYDENSKDDYVITIFWLDLEKGIKSIELILIASLIGLVVFNLI